MGNTRLYSPFIQNQDQDVIDLIGEFTDTHDDETIFGVTDHILDDIAVVNALHGVPNADAETNTNMRDVVGNKTDAAVTTVGTTKTLMAYIKGIVTAVITTIPGLHAVPTADVDTNTNSRDVVGNKTDAAVTTVGTTKTLMAYIKGIVTAVITTIPGLHAVPSADVETNTNVRDVVGNKTDAAVTTVGTTKTLMAYLKGVVTAVITTIPGLHGVPAKDATTDTNMRDVIGKKDDTAVVAVGTDKSILGYVKGAISLLVNATYGLSATKTEVESSSLNATGGAVADTTRLGSLVRWIADAINSASIGLSYIADKANSIYNMFAAVTGLIAYSANQPKYYSAVSDTLQEYTDTEVTTQSTDYVLVTSIISSTPFPRDLSAGFRVKFDLKVDDPAGTAYAKVYVNESEVGAEQTDVTGSYVTKSQDITSASTHAHKIEVYAKVDVAARTAYVKNFRLYYDMYDSTSKDLDTDLGEPNDSTTDTLHGKIGTDTEMGDVSLYDMLKYYLHVTDGAASTIDPAHMADGSIFAKIISKTANGAAPEAFDCTTDSLEALSDKLGTTSDTHATASIFGLLDKIYDAVITVDDYVDAEVGTIVTAVGTTIPGLLGTSADDHEDTTIYGVLDKVYDMASSAHDDAATAAGHNNPDPAGTAAGLLTDMAKDSEQETATLDAGDGSNADHARLGEIARWLADLGLDKLIGTADGTDVFPDSVADDSILAKIMSKGDPAAGSFNNTTDSLEMTSDKIGAYSGDGGAAADDSVKAELDLIKADTDNIPAAVYTRQVVPIAMHCAKLTINNTQADKDFIASNTTGASGLLSTTDANVGKIFIVIRGRVENTYAGQNYLDCSTASHNQWQINLDGGAYADITNEDDGGQMLDGQWNIGVQNGQIAFEYWYQCTATITNIDGKIGLRLANGRAKQASMDIWMEGVFLVIDWKNV